MYGHTVLYCTVLTFEQGRDGVAKIKVGSGRPICYPGKTA